MTARILVVDDEPKLVRLVREVFKATGYEVVIAASGQEAIDAVAVEQPDLVVLDITLQGNLNGFDVARRVREFSSIPIIMLTARVHETDLLEGFDAGADDYLTKPFSSKELLVRVRALLRRAAQQAPEAIEPALVCGPLHIDLARRRVSREGEPVHLTRTEFNLLRELAQHPDQVLLHEQLLSAVWGVEYRDDVDYLRAYIRHLRQKLEADPANPQLIVTHPGVGYRLACEN